MTSMHPSTYVAATYGRDLKALGAVDVSPGKGGLNVRFANNAREHLVKNLVRANIEGVKLLTSADSRLRCGPPAPIDAVRAAKLIGSAGLTGVAAARVDSSAAGSPTMVVDVMVGSEKHVANLLRDQIGGADVRIAVQGD